MFPSFSFMIYFSSCLIRSRHPLFSLPRSRIRLGDPPVVSNFNSTFHPAKQKIGQGPLLLWDRKYGNVDDATSGPMPSRWDSSIYGASGRCNIRSTLILLLSLCFQPIHSHTLTILDIPFFLHHLSAAHHFPGPSFPPFIVTYSSFLTIYFARPPVFFQSMRLLSPIQLHTLPKTVLLTMNITIPDCPLQPVTCNLTSKCTL